LETINLKHLGDINKKFEKASVKILYPEAKKRYCVAGTGMVIKIHKFSTNSTDICSNTNKLPDGQQRQINNSRTYKITAWRHRSCFATGCIKRPEAELKGCKTRQYALQHLATG
jgi:hypothetical protein